MALPIDLPLHPLPVRPIVRRECVAPVEAGGEGEASRDHRRTPPIPALLLPLPFADFLHRQNIIWRLTEPEGAIWGSDRRSEGGERGPAARAGRRAVAEPGPRGWPRLGDVPPERTAIDRRVEVAYRAEIHLGIGTRLDRVG